VLPPVGAVGVLVLPPPPPPQPKAVSATASAPAIVRLFLIDFASRDITDQSGEQRRCLMFSDKLRVFSTNCGDRAYAWRNGLRDWSVTRDPPYCLMTL
jgi:hypothetical protein